MTTCAVLLSACVKVAEPDPDDPVVEPDPPVVVPDEPSEGSETMVIDQVYTLNINRTGEKIPGRKEEREGCLVCLTDKDGKELLTSDGGIRLRGNGTRNLPKSPYDLKLTDKASVLGMPKNRRWVLLANYLDRTSLRNDVGLEIARRASGMPWNPRGEFVNLYLDGSPCGLYYLCEKIRIGKKRVDTDGYLLEFDSYSDEPVYWTDRFRHPVKIKEPDEIVDEQVKYVLGYLNELEAVLTDGPSLAAHAYEDYIDIDSFIDWWLTGELVMCKDYNGPASVYMYKGLSGKIFAGPIWDLDLYTFSSKVHNVNSFLLDGSVYYSALFKDPKFREAVKGRWPLLKSALEDGDSIYDYIDSRSMLIKDAVAFDDVLYGKRSYSVLAGDESVDFETAVGMMKSFLRERVAAMDRLIEKL